MIANVYHDTVRTSGCGCCSKEYALTPEAERKYVPLLTRGILEKHIEEMEGVLAECRDILEGLPKGE